MEIKKNRQFKILFLVLLIPVGLVIASLPILNSQSQEVENFNLPVLITTVAITGISVFFWTRLVAKKFTRESRILGEVLIWLIGINMVVKFTGGVYSYFAFLYFLPVFYAASNLSFVALMATAFFASLVMILQLLNLESGSIPQLIGVLTVNLFGIWLVADLGRSLAHKLNLIAKRSEELEIEQIKAVDKLKDEFVFIIAHELRSPITAIRGYLDLIRTEKSLKISSELRDLLENGFRASAKLAGLVAVLLEIARFETGKINFYFQNVNLKSSLDHSLGSLESERAQKDIKIIQDMDENLFVWIDKERLEEIFTILIGNALEYAPPGSEIVINASKETKERVVVSVIDNGSGLDPEKKKRLFDKFYYEKNQDGVLKVKSYGVSLYAVKQLLKLMDSDITCEDNKPQGTVFNLYLPVK